MKISYVFVYRMIFHTSSSYVSWVTYGMNMICMAAISYCTVTAVRIISYHIIIIRIISYVTVTVRTVALRYDVTYDDPVWWYHTVWCVRKHASYHMAMCLCRHAHMHVTWKIYIVGGGIVLWKRAGCVCVCVCVCCTAKGVQLFNPKKRQGTLPVRYSSARRLTLRYVCIPGVSTE